MNRLDYEYYGQRQDAPVLRRPPSEYVDERCYFTSQPVEGMDKRGYVAEMVRLMGGECNLMFASDYPHHDFDHADDLLGQLAGEFDCEESEAVFDGTATEVYRFR